MEAEDDFSGIVIDIRRPMAKGIFDLTRTDDVLHTNVHQFFNVRGVRTADGYRPGIGSTGAWPGWLQGLIRAVPAVGKLIVALANLCLRIQSRLVEYKKKKLRPFVPSVGIHLDIWPRKDIRPRTPVADLMNTLEMIPGLLQEIATKNPGINVELLVTSKFQGDTTPVIRLDSDACTIASMVKLTSKIYRSIKKSKPPTHVTLTRRFGFWPKIELHYDSTQAFHMIFLFPENAYKAK